MKIKLFALLAILSITSVFAAHKLTGDDYVLLDKAAASKHPYKLILNTLEDFIKDNKITEDEAEKLEREYRLRAKEYKRGRALQYRQYKEPLYLNPEDVVYY